MEPPDRLAPADIGRTILVHRAGSSIMEFSAADYRLMARTFRLRAADEVSEPDIARLIAAARRYESLARRAEKLEGSKRFSH